MRRFTFETPAGDMAALEFGNPAHRLAAVWLHATGFNAMTYQSILAPLGLRTKVQAVDLRGHGRTTLPAKAWKMKSWKRHRDDIIAYLDREAPTKPVVLGGHSMGATVALMVAGARPAKVAGLVLVDPVILTPRMYFYAHLMPFMFAMSKSATSLQKRARKRRAEFGSQAEILDAFAKHKVFSSWRDPFMSDYVIDAFDRVDDNAPDSDEQLWKLLCKPAWEAASYRAQRNRPWGALAKVRKHRIPITIIQPERDSVLSDRVAARLLRKCPHLDLKERANTSHFLPMEAPYDVRDQLSAYISSQIEGFATDELGPVKRSLRGSG